MCCTDLLRIFFQSGLTLDSGHARQGTVKCGRERQEGDRVATGRRQGGDRKTTGQRQESGREATGSDRQATGERQGAESAETATGRRQEGDRMATGGRGGPNLLRLLVRLPIDHCQRAYKDQVTTMVFLLVSTRCSPVDCVGIPLKISSKLPNSWYQALDAYTLWNYNESVTPGDSYWIQHEALETILAVGSYPLSFLGYHYFYMIGFPSLGSSSS